MTYLNEIRNDIALEFGFEAIGYGKNKLDVSTAKEMLAKWNALSKDEQEQLLASRR
mgnify:CR=1 FL=1